MRTADLVAEALDIGGDYADRLAPSQRWMATLRPSAQSLRADPRSCDSGAKSWPGQASEHDADRGETDEGGGGSSVALEVAGQATASTDPGQGTLDDPAFGKDDEAMQLVALDDLQRPGAGLCEGGGGRGSLVAGVGEDALDEGKRRRVR